MRPFEFCCVGALECVGGFRGVVAGTGTRGVAGGAFGVEAREGLLEPGRHTIVLGGLGSAGNVKMPSSSSSDSRVRSTMPLPQSLRMLEVVAVICTKLESIASSFNP